MLNYYDTNIIPIILKTFKTKEIVICGTLDEKTTKQLSNYSNEHSIDTVNQNYLNIDFVNENSFDTLSKIQNYDAIFLNGDPNWYVVYNELKIIKKNNNEFPLVFICHNIFPHKRRDSYINPKLIPKEFRKNNSKTLDYNNITILDNYYHALDENTPMNGVLTAIEDFINENKKIGILNLNLINGITILYPKNSISQIRLTKLSHELEGHNLENANLSDNIIENRLLKNYISKYKLANEKLDSIVEFEEELDEKNRIINSYENKIKLHEDEINYKDAQIESYDSKLNLKESQIKNYESKLTNQEHEIDKLNNKLEEVNTQITSLKTEINKNEQNYKNKEQQFNTQITSLKTEINKNEQNKTDLLNQLKHANTEIKGNIELLNKKNEEILSKNNQITHKQKQLKEKEEIITSIKQQHTHQLSKLDNKEYCINCYKEEITNNHLEIEYLKKESLTKKLLVPFGYLYIFFKSNPKEISLNLKLYKTLKKSKCFDIGFYLNNNKDIIASKWCKYFSPELHYVCNGFNEKRKFNKKYFNRNSKRELLEYILNCEH